jgi:hypothetical protein
MLRSVIDDRSVRLCDRFGNMLLLPSLREAIALHLFAFGVYEPDTIAAIVARLSASGVYVDVGANVGALALAVAAQRPATRIVCIDADPEIVDVLRRNVTENKRSNVTIVECLAGPAADRAVPLVVRKPICYRSGIDCSISSMVACLAQLLRLLGRPAGQ